MNNQKVISFSKKRKYVPIRKAYQFLLKYIFSKDHLFILILLAIAITFKEPIELIIKEFIIDKYLSKINPATSIDIILLILIAASTTYFIHRLILGRKISNSNKNKNLLFIVLLYLTYRLCQDKWEYTNFDLDFFKQLTYFDLLFISFSLLLVDLYKHNKNIIIDHNKSFIEDTPKSFYGQNFINQEQTLQILFDKVNNTAPVDNSLAIGITGSWGSGKTNFLNKLKRKLSKDGAFNIIEFNPWILGDTKNITTDFLQTFSSYITLHDNAIASVFKQYIEHINIENESFLSKIKMSLHSRNKTTTKLYSDIKTHIRNRQIRNIVFIDDIDRLTNEEILEIFRVIRNTANFPYTIFILAYDVNYLKDTLEIDAEQYIKKIIQVEICLPFINRTSIINALQHLWSRPPFSYDSHLVSEIHEAINITSNYKGKSLVIDCLHNMRDVIRFSNSAQYLYSLNNTNINTRDFFILELIKYRYKDVYDSIYNQTIVEMDGQKYTYINSIEVREKTTQTLVTYLQFLFNEDTIERNKSIINPNFFLVYFIPELFRKITPNDIQELLLMNTERKIKKIAYWRGQNEQGNLREIIRNSNLATDFTTLQSIIEVLILTSDQHEINDANTIVNEIIKFSDIHPSLFQKQYFKDFLYSLCSSERPISNFYLSLSLRILKESLAEWYKIASDKEVVVNLSKLIASNTEVFYATKTSYIDSLTDIRIERSIIRLLDDSNYEFIRLKTLLRHLRHNRQDTKYEVPQFIEIVSDSNEEFIGTNISTIKNDDFKTISFEEHEFSIKSISNEFLSETLFIAHTYPITDEEAASGGEYIFEKTFNISDIKIKNATFYAFADDNVEITIRENSHGFSGYKPEKLLTSDITKMILTTENKLIIKVINKNWEIEYPNQKWDGYNNPYGICYCIRINIED